MAVHSFDACPLFAFDGINAKVDLTNVACVARYIYKRTRTNGKNIISKKCKITLGHFLAHADLLVGVAWNVDKLCSQNFSATIFQPMGPQNKLERAG